MLHFLIDFENVGNSGLQGAGQLSGGDCVVIFFSQARNRIEQRKFQQITESGCEFEICKLHKTGKNALDFYIATRVGEICGSRSEGSIAIISNDKGFEAVRDYWRKRKDNSRTIILRPNIEKAIVSLNENSLRCARLRQSLQEVGIEEEYAHFQERRRVKEELKDLFCGTEYEGVIPQIQDILERKSERKIIYLDHLKQFGRKDGLAIYSRVKQMVG